MSKERVEKKINDFTLSIETGEVAKQANGAVVVAMGETQILVTACAASKPRPDAGFFPLTVEYRPRTYAAGRIPGGFFKREGRPRGEDVLTARLTDRPIRPRFPKDFMNETQIWCMPVSFDVENDPDVLGLLGASAALTISDIPFDGPIGAIRVGYVGDDFVANPTLSQREASVIDLIIAGTGKDIIMVEGSANEVSEDFLVEALEFAKPHLAELCDLQNELAKRVGKTKFEYEPVGVPSDELDRTIREKVGDRITDLTTIPEKMKRKKAMDDLFESIIEELDEEFEDLKAESSKVFSEIERETMRRMILQDKKRIDGRGPGDIRPITIVPSYLRRTHGSALFTRGETQALAVLTLGTKMDEQKIEDLEGESFKSFLLHYNFPPFSVGEVRRATGPGRREIGHGALAELSLIHI